MLTYLDDSFLLVPTIHAPAALEAARQRLQQIGLELNASKTEMATKGPHDPPLAQLYKANLQIMGVTHALFKGLEGNLPDDQLARGTPLQPNDSTDNILTAQARFCEALLRLRNKHLLKPSTTMTLLRNFHNNVSVHRIRAAKTSDEIAQRWDNFLRTTICTIFNIPNTQTLAQLRNTPPNKPRRLGNL